MQTRHSPGTTPPSCIDCTVNIMASDPYSLCKANKPKTLISESDSSSNYHNILAFRPRCILSCIYGSNKLLTSDPYSLRKAPGSSRLSPYCLWGAALVAVRFVGAFLVAVLLVRSLSGRSSGCGVPSWSQFCLWGASLVAVLFVGSLPGRSSVCAEPLWSQFCLWGAFLVAVLRVGSLSGRRSAMWWKRNGGIGKNTVDFSVCSFF